MGLKINTIAIIFSLTIIPIILSKFADDFNNELNFDGTVTNSWICFTGTGNVKMKPVNSGKYYLTISVDMGELKGAKNYITITNPVFQINKK